MGEKIRQEVEPGECATAADRPMRVSAQEHYEMVAVAAYFLAEHRGFDPGRENDDWREAEAQIDGMLAAMAATGVGREEYERQGIRNALRLWRS